MELAWPMGARPGPREQTKKKIPKKKNKQTNKKKIARIEPRSSQAQVSVFTTLPLLPHQVKLRGELPYMNLPL